jgi:branched-chain amino acid transport system permease protein
VARPATQAHDPAVVPAVFRPSRAGLVTRLVVAGVIIAAILLAPVAFGTTQDLWIGLAAIYAIIGLSVNILTGHAGQISLGHQAFVGIGAFMAAFVVRKVGGFTVDPTTGLVIAPSAIPTPDFWLGLIVAGLTGALMAVLLGLVALRIRGLYLALVTLAFGLMAETTIFNWRAFTGGGAGAATPRPATFQSNQAYAYVCLAILAVFLFVDWRLVKSRAGRAMVAFRNDERAAATLGISVTGGKLLAFGAAGFLAGVAGGLFGHWNQAVQALDFELRTALVWVLMAVVGGLGSRAGVVIGSAFFAVFPLYLSAQAGGATLPIPGLGDVLIQTLSPFFGALLLLVTITLYPGGIGQQLLWIRRWISGGPLVESRHEAMRVAGLPALIALLVTVMATDGPGLQRILFGLVAAVGAAVLSVLFLLEYLRRLHRTSAREAARRRGPGATAAGPRGPASPGPGAPPAVAPTAEAPARATAGVPGADGSRERQPR